MSSDQNGVFSYESYRLVFLLAICMSSYVLLNGYIICLIVLCMYRLSVYIKNRCLGNIESQNRAVFITGCDTGLGNRFAKYLDATGFVVFAGCLNKDSAGAKSLISECTTRLNVVQVNTTKEESINAAFNFVKTHLPSKGLWGVINNAGMDMLGDVELSPVSLYERGFELNMYGYIRVMKTFLPLIRQAKGRVVNVTSVRGRIVEPNQSNYSTAKHAIETLSDSLRLEMIKFGVNVSIIEPGNFGNATAIGSEAVIKRNQQEVDEMWESARDEVKQSYSKKYLESWINSPVGGWPPKADSTIVAKAVAHALCSVSPKHRYLIQGKGSIVPFVDEFVVLSYVHNMLPTWIVNAYMYWWKKRYVQSPSK